jgi:L,D-transpeptidase ErfK/SrfK
VLPWLAGQAPAATFALTYEQFDLVGYERTVAADYDDTLLDIARRNGIGQEEIVLANPEVDRWLPGEGAEVVIPSRYVLPDSPREGLVLNLPEMRLYYFPEPAEGETREVQTYPVSIGRMDWGTPLGATTVVRKQEDPPWYPPESIRKEHAEQGDPLPRMVPPGPDNPLGRHAIRLGIPGYLIHGTNKAFGVGMRVSHGCVRMLPEDIEGLFPQVERGTPVYIINQPIKAGWYGGKLYLEVHPPLEEYPLTEREMDELVSEVLDKALSLRATDIDESAVTAAVRRMSGMPTDISRELQ